MAFLLNEAKCKYEKEASETKEKEGHEEELAKAMALKCLHNAAEACRVNPIDLIEMPPGPRRRTMIDDISIIVVHLAGV